MLEKRRSTLCFSIVHFDYGLLSYFVFGRFDEKKSDDEFLFDNFGNVNWSKGLLSEENLGLFIALSIAVAFESIENSEAVIDLFRKNSGRVQVREIIPNESLTF